MHTTQAEGSGATTRPIQDEHLLRQRGATRSKSDFAWGTGCRVQGVGLGLGEGAGRVSPNPRQCSWWWVVVEPPD